MSTLLRCSLTLRPLLRESSPNALSAVEGQGEEHPLWAAAAAFFFDFLLDGVPTVVRGSAAGGGEGLPYSLISSHYAQAHFCVCFCREGGKKMVRKRQRKENG